MDLSHYQSNYSKDLKSANLKCSVLQAKHLMIIQEKDDRVKVVLSYCLQQNVSVQLHMIKKLKQFPLQLGKAVAAAS